MTNAKQGGGASLWRTVTGPAPVRLLACVLVALAFPGENRMVAAEAPEVSEEQVKAAFLINFPKYVDWPTDALAESNSPIVVAIFGETALDRALRKMLAGKTVNGHPLVFKRVSTEEECDGGYHILFIGDGATRHTAEILGKLGGASVLTVGDSESFLDDGGIIKLAKRDRKIRLEVNLVAANRTHLKLSSKLLAVADVVRGNPRSGGGG
jgi:hypothetical protein